MDHAIKTIDADYILWLDADTYTFRKITKEFVTGLLPSNKLVNFLGRGAKYPECGWVCYNKRHPKVKEFMKYWTDLYINDTIFKELEWHDSYVFWHLTKIYRKEKNIKVNDIGRWKGVRGHHVFINSELGLYMDHMKGNRKTKGSSTKNDLRQSHDVDYWKKIPPV
ncbi:MAG TPA: hypothetical protein DEG69_07180 [Flavobacteriaceae bacterium]|nr:hypothetical protein [Flavobacteriaceae bacterium]